jgi:tRNA(Leu) C34 or U34 (ribose-2'-O)-methylase TrmL
MDGSTISSTSKTALGNPCGAPIRSPIASLSHGSKSTIARPRARGFAVVALVNPKTPANIGGAMRAAGCYGGAMVVLGGPRPERLSRLPTDTQRAWRHIPHVLVADVFDAIPFDCIPVAVDLLPGAQPLPAYTHPERAFYIFGAEDATLSHAIVLRCRDKVVVPTTYCMNLAATVNVVLYDRLAKQ